MLTHLHHNRMLNNVCVIFSIFKIKEYLLKIFCNKVPPYEMAKKCLVSNCYIHKIQ